MKKVILLCLFVVGMFLVGCAETEFTGDEMDQLIDQEMELGESDAVAGQAVKPWGYTWIACEDTDGNDTSVAGSVTATYEYGKSRAPTTRTMTRADRCLSPGKGYEHPLREMYCEGYKMRYFHHDCEFGCEDGACVEEDPCETICQDKYGTEGVCNGTIGDAQGSMYCPGSNQCVCLPPSCEVDNDCDQYGTHLMCLDNQCLHPDCNTACIEFYDYDSGECGVEGGFDVGSVYCDLTFEQCKCFNSTG